MALSADAQIARKESGLQSYPVSSGSTIYKGALVCVDEDGYLVAAADTAGYKFAGIAYEQKDNSGGSDGDLWCRVYTEGVFKLTCTSIAQTMVGERMYLTDDATVDDQATTAWMCVGRLVEYVSATSGWVDIGQRDNKHLEDNERLTFGDSEDVAVYWNGTVLYFAGGGVRFNGSVQIDAGASFTCDNVTARIAQGITGLTVSDHPTFAYIVLSTSQGVTGLGTGDAPTFTNIHLSISQGVTGLTVSDHPTFAALTVGYIVVNGQADFPLDLSGITVNSGGADIKLNNNQRILNTHAATRAAARAAAGNTAPLGSIVIGDDARATTKPDVYVKVASNNNDSDWERLVTQASD